MVASILKIVITRNTIVTTWLVFQNGVTYVTGPGKGTKWANKI